MKTLKFILSVLSYICITSMVMANAVEYIPKGPKETAEFEKGLYQLLPGYVHGIYPKAAILANGVSEKTLSPESATRIIEYKERIETWLTRVLRIENRPKQLNKAQWSGIRKLHWDRNYIVGRFLSNAEKGNIYENAVLEFQADDRSIDLTVTSPSLFTAEANGLSNAQVRNFTSKILNIPQEKVNKIEIEKHFITVAGIDLCYGKMRCEWNEKDSKDSEREWWSYIPFWYVKGKMFVHISTIDWKSEDRPAVAKDSWSF